MVTIVADPQRSAAIDMSDEAVRSLDRQVRPGPGVVWIEQAYPLAFVDLHVGTAALAGRPERRHPAGEFLP
jgi:hypothetical protein